VSLDYVGELPLGVLCSTSLTAVAGISASFAAVLPQIAIDLEAAIQCSISLGISPPNLAADIALCVQLLIDLNLALSVSLPSLDFQLAAVLALIAQLSPILASISASLSLSLPLAELFAVAGIQAYQFAGAGGQFGSLMGQAIGIGFPDGTPASEDVFAVVLASTSAPVWTGMGEFFTLIQASQAPGTVEYLGDISIGAMVGLLSSGILSANLALNFQLGQITAQIQGALALSASLSASPPSISGSLTIVANLKASLEAYLTLGGFVLPTAAITAIVSLVAQLTALVAQLKANITLMANLTTALSLSGVLVYTYTGTGTGFGPALTTALATQWPDATPSTDPSNALVLVATGTAGQVGLTTFFAGL
jgi:hypothetical protein